MARQFRKTYLNNLQKLYDTDQLRFYGRCTRQDFSSLICGVRKKSWIVYAKAPFAGPHQVLDYLGRYTHRVAISNHRLVSIDNQKVCLSYKDRNDNNRTRQMSLSAKDSYAQCLHLNKHHRAAVRMLDHFKTFNDLNRMKNKAICIQTQYCFTETMDKTLFVKP